MSEHKIFKGHCKNNSPNQNLCVIINGTLKICSENFEIENNNLDNLSDKIVNNSENLSNLSVNQIQVGEIYDVKLTQITNLSFKGEII